MFTRKENDFKEKEDREKLADQIWFTRTSRIKAEERLIKKEQFTQFVNIYYSLVAIICSIISYHYGDSKMSLFTIIITVSLMVSILYLNGQSYLKQARDYRTNYTYLHHLSMKVKDNQNDLSDIQKEYCELLNSSSNHIEYDYLKALSNSDYSYKRKKGWKTKKYLYYWNCFWRLLIKVIVLVVPGVILWLCEVFG